MKLNLLNLIKLEIGEQEEKKPKEIIIKETIKEVVIEKPKEIKSIKESE